MKVLIITYYWPPSGGAGVHRWLALSGILSEAGPEVHVLTVKPDQASYLGRDPSLQEKVPPDIHVHRSDSWEPLQWYQKLTGRELPQGGGTGLPPGLKGKLLKMVRTHFFIPDARRGWVKYAFTKAVDLIQKHEISNVIISSPPHSTQLIGLKLKSRLNINLIVDFRDPWTDLYYNEVLGSSSYSRKVNQELEKKVLENANWVITVGKRLAKLLESKTSIPINTLVVHNGFEGSVKSAHYVKQRTVGLSIAYTGKLTDQFPCQALVLALNKLVMSSRTEAVTWQIIGPVQQEVKKRLVKDSKYQLKFLGTLPHDNIAQFQANADVLLLIIPTGMRNDLILTGKLFEYLKAMRPILCIGPANGDAADIIRETNAGRVFDYDDAIGVENWLVEVSNGQWEFQPDIQAILRYSRHHQGIKILQALV